MQTNHKRGRWRIPETVNVGTVYNVGDKNGKKQEETSVCLFQGVSNVLSPHFLDWSFGLQFWSKSDKAQKDTKDIIFYS